jgi:hypothetical protein
MRRGEIFIGGFAHPASQRALRTLAEHICAVKTAGPRGPCSFRLTDTPGQSPRPANVGDAEIGIGRGAEQNGDMLLRVTGFAGGQS